MTFQGSAGAMGMFQDLIEDRTRLRLLTVLVSVLMYLLLTFDLLAVEKVVPKTTISEIAFSSTVPAFVYMGDALAHAPGVQAMDEDGEFLGGRVITATVKSMFVTETHDTLDCTTSTLQELQGTLEGMQISAPCALGLSGGLNSTDAWGDTRFTDLKFEGGPTGIYHLEFGVSGTEEDSVAEPVSAVIEVLSTVLHIQPKSIPPYQVKFNETFSTFQVEVLSDEWRRLEGRRVTVFAGDRPEIRMRGRSTHHMFGQAYALVEGATAVTNADGVATFSKFKVTAATQAWTYLYFYCEGTVVSWSSESAKGERAIDGIEDETSPVYVPPILLTYDLWMSELQSFPSSIVLTFADGTSVSEAAEMHANGDPVADTDITITEGLPLPTENLRVCASYEYFENLDFSMATLKPLVGEKIIALVAIADGHHFMNMYEPNDEGEGAVHHKDLLNPVSTLTDSNGCATFDALAFSVRGHHGNYRLRFAMGGFVSADLSPLIRVQTSIASVEVLTEGRVLLNMFGGQQGAKKTAGASKTIQNMQETLIVRASDANGEPIAGKRVSEVDLVSMDGSAIVGSSLLVNVDPTLGLRSETARDGLAVVQCEFVAIPPSVADPDCVETSDTSCPTARLRVTIDGVQSTVSERTAIGVAPRTEAKIAKDQASVHQEGAWACQRVHLDGMPPAFMQTELAEIHDEEAEFLSRCIDISTVSVHARNADNDELPLCALLETADEEPDNGSVDSATDCLVRMPIFAPNVQLVLEHCLLKAFEQSG